MILFNKARKIKIDEEEQEFYNQLTVYYPNIMREVDSGKCDVRFLMSWDRNKLQYLDNRLRDQYERLLERFIAIAVYISIGVLIYSVYAK